MNFAMKIALFVLAGTSIAQANIGDAKVYCKGTAVSNVPKLNGPLEIEITSTSPYDRLNQRKDFITDRQVLDESVYRFYPVGGTLRYQGEHSRLDINLLAPTGHGPSYHATTQVKKRKGTYVSEDLICTLDPFTPN